MQTEALARQRYRTLAIALVFQVLLALGGAWGAYRLPERHPFEWMIYLLSGLACGLIWWRARLARQAGQQQALERWTLMLVLLGAGMLLQRLALTLFGLSLEKHGLSLFRPIFAYLPFVYLAAFLLLPSRKAMIVNWSLCTVVTVLLLAGVHHQTGFVIQSTDEISVLMWILLGNPLFLIMLGALPRYEDWLRIAGYEVQQLRERSNLLDRVSASEKRFDLVVDSLQVGVWDHHFDAEGRAQRWWSPRFYALLGYTPEEMPANEMAAKQLVGDNVRGIVDAIYSTLEKDGVTTLDLRMRTKDRGWRWFNVTCKAEFDDRRRLLRVAGAIEDIHARRIAEIELQEAQAELIALAYRDPLTALPNRRAFDEQLKREWDRARRNDKPLSLLTLDIDWFKNYNDFYGHPAGDECLRRVAEVISECLRRPGDFAARVGGEEFQVVMPETDALGALQVAKTLEATLRERALPHQASALGVVTCSIGVASETATAKGSLDALLGRADHGLYESKRGGRSRVTAV